MAKDKKDKAKKVKVPKEVGGVKVPKKLRKLGDQAVKLAKEPVVAEVVAGALLAAAAALREGKDPKGAVGAALKGGMKTVTGGGKNKGTADGPRLSDSLKLIALDFARRAMEPRENKDGAPQQGEVPSADAAAAQQPEAPNKPPQAAEVPAAGASSGNGRKRG